MPSQSFIDKGYPQVWYGVCVCITLLCESVAKCLWYLCCLIWIVHKMYNNYNIWDYQTHTDVYIDTIMLASVNKRQKLCTHTHDAYMAHATTMCAWLEESCVKRWQSRLIIILLLCMHVSTMCMHKWVQNFGNKSVCTHLLNLTVNQTDRKVQLVFKFIKPSCSYIQYRCT